MSLLLDALKKAEADKKQHQTKQDATESISSQQDIDLNLDLDRHALNKPAADIDEPYLDTSELDASDATVKQLVPDITNESINQTENLLNSIHREIPESNRTNILNKTISTDRSENNQTIASHNIKIESSGVETAKECVESNNNSDASITRSNHYHNNGQDLAKLLDTANNHYYKQKFKSTILFFMLIIFFILFAFIYFYIQNSSSQTDIYLQIPQTIKNETSEINASPKEASNNTTSSEPTYTQTSSYKDTQTSVLSNKNESTSINTIRADNNIKSAPPIRERKINVTQTVKQDPIEIFLTSAYIAFNKSDYVSSKQLYIQVLSQEPTNRDAQLGLAAIAIQNKQPQIALQHYQRLLKLNPKDSLALAGFTNLNQSSNFLTESQLKVMLREQPNASHLHFALGNYYARNNRWQEAQSYYFNAWSLHNEQAEYSYNLAISLEHLSKYLQAIKFYELSLSLHKNNSNIQFTKQRVIERISLLKESIQ